MTERLHETHVEIEVPFHDVDALGVVWHGNYYKYLEIARTSLLRSLGLDAGSEITHRFRLLIVETKCRYASPLRYGDRIRVAAWIREHARRITVAYEITNLATDRRAARAHTILVTTDREGRLLMETPDEIVGYLLR
jgi:acyl-CoA thioester hydrolase